MRLMKLQHKEHEMWQEVCAALKQADAVTEEDLCSRLSERRTDGQKLLALLRGWGEALVELHQAARDE